VRKRQRDGEKVELEGKKGVKEKELGDIRKEGKVTYREERVEVRVRKELKKEGKGKD